MGWATPKTLSLEEEETLLKTCLKCLEVLPLVRFHKKKDGKYGRYSLCKKCRRGESVSYNLAHQQEQTDYQRNYRIEHKDKAKESLNRSYVKHRQVRLADQKDYHNKNKATRNAYSQNYQKTHRKEINLSIKNRAEGDLEFRLTRRVRASIKRAFRNSSCTTKKKGSSIVALGCSGKEYVNHIESTFWPGMTRENNGPIKWEVDHIVPLDSFDRGDPDWIYKAFNWTNTQALWKDDNRNKWNRADWSPAESEHELPERLK